MLVIVLMMDLPQVLSGIQIAVISLNVLIQKTPSKSLSGEVHAVEQWLAFVIDTTGRMWEEIESAKRIILDFLRSEEEIGVYGCYMLVPLNDVGPNHEIVHEQSKSTNFVIINFLLPSCNFVVM